MSNSPVSVVPIMVSVAPKPWYFSRTVWYNVGKGILGFLAFVTMLLTFQVGAQHQGISPFVIPENYLLYGIALLAMVDSAIGVWLRTDTNAPITGG